MHIGYFLAIILLQASLRPCQKTKGPNGCTPGALPRGTYGVNCTYGDETVRHGKIKGRLPPSCLGLYCWNGTLTPIRCQIPKPRSISGETYVRPNETWPRCCYWRRQCPYVE
uniref:8.9 kDa family member n=1 Tax=Rhipicephalus appendiculatus TaxID=34631 RepID=A0A131YHK7_RHIAP